MNFRNTSSVLILCFLIYAQPAMAYIDPSTGSFVIQAIIAFFISGFVWFKTMFVPKAKIKAQEGEETINESEAGTDEIT